MSSTPVASSPGWFSVAVTLPGRTPGSAQTVGIDDTAPYSVEWTTSTAGTYQLSAYAYDIAGGLVASAMATITVRPPNVPPTVSRDEPAERRGVYGARNHHDFSRCRRRRWHRGPRELLRQRLAHRDRP